MAGSDKPKEVSIPAWQKAKPASEIDTQEQEQAPTPSEPETLNTDRPLLEETGIAPGPDQTTPTEIDQVRQFLKDISVKDAPMDKKRAFLESKGVSKEMIDTVLSSMSAGEEEITQRPPQFDPTEFKSNWTKPTSNQTTPRDIPPIITYPEFLIQPQKPPPLVTVSRLVNTAYFAGGLAATFYGLSKFIIAPMTSSLIEARHDFAQHTDAKLGQLNEKLGHVVTSDPIPKTKTIDNGPADSDSDSIASDPTELFHRDIGTQTADLAPTSYPDTSYEIEPATVKTIVEKQQDRLKIMASHMNDMLLDSNSNGTTNQQVQESVTDLKQSLDQIIYALPPPIEGTWTPLGSQQKKKEEDAIAAFKAEIRSVKGVLLSAKRFPSSATASTSTSTSTPVSTRVGG